MASKLAKKLPKRVGNVKRQSRREASWKRGQEKKAQRRNAQLWQYEVNEKTLRDHGIMSRKTETKTAIRKLLGQAA